MRSSPPVSWSPPESTRAGHEPFKTALIGPHAPHWRGDLMATTTMRNPAPTAISQDVRVDRTDGRRFTDGRLRARFPRAPRSVFVSPPCAPRARAGGVRRPQDPDPMEEGPSLRAGA